MKVSRATRAEPIVRGLLTGVLCLGLWWPASAGAQLLRGKVVDARGRGLAGANVSLLPEQGTSDSTVADDEGRFRFSVSKGRVRLVARRLGFAPTSDSLVIVGDTTEHVVQLSPLPARLLAMQIQAERGELRQTRVLGMALRGLDAPVVTPTEVALVSRGAQSWLDVVRASGIGGLTISGDCVVSIHALRRECVVILVDDVRVDDRVNISGLVLPRTISHLIYLRAAQATTLLGTGAPSGALLIYTNIGARIVR